MSVLIRNDEKRDWVVTGEGEGHSHCPGCDSDVEAIGGFGGEHGTPLMWNQYNHDMKAGGCGATWTTTTAAGQQRNESRGARTKWLTEAAATGRIHSVPSEQFKANYDRIFRSK